MLRSRLAAAMMVASACVVFVAVGVFSSARHDEEAAPEAQAPGRRALRVPDRVAMPRGLVGLELAFGLHDNEPTEWEGDITLSAGEVVDVQIVESGVRAEARGGHFRVASRKSTLTKKQAKKQAKKQGKTAEELLGIVPVRMRVNLRAPADATFTVATPRGQFSGALADLKRGAVRRSSAAAPRSSESIPPSASPAARPRRTIRPQPRRPTAPSGSPTRPTPPSGHDWPARSHRRTSTACSSRSTTATASSSAATTAGAGSRRCR